MRTGILSDTSLEKECLAFRPPPMNRVDLLPPNYSNTSGVYTRKLKNPKVISRPETLVGMSKSIENVSGVNPMERILQNARKEIQFKPITYEDSKINPYYEYLNQAEQVGSAAGILENMELTVTGLPFFTQTYPPPTTLAEFYTPSERQRKKLEIERRQFEAEPERQRPAEVTYTGRPGRPKEVVLEEREKVKPEIPEIRERQQEFFRVTGEPLEVKEGKITKFPSMEAVEKYMETKFMTEGIL